MFRETLAYWQRKICIFKKIISLKKLIAFYILMNVCVGVVKAQTIELTGGLLFKKMIQTFETEENKKTTHTIQPGFAYHISLSQIKTSFFDDHTFKANFHYYNIPIHTQISRKGSEENIQYRFHVIGMAIYPFQCKIIKNFYIDAGLEVNALLRTSVNGTIKNIDYNQNIITYNPIIDAQLYEGETISTNINLDFVYNIPINKKWALTLQEKLRMGVFNELENVIGLSNITEIGIVKQLHEKKKQSTFKTRYY